MCVFVDCDWGKKNEDLSTKYKVQGYPTVTFLDPEGKEVGELGGRDATTVAAQITEIAKKHSKAAFESFEKAAGVAKEEKKPVLYLFVKPGVNSSIAAALADPANKDLVEKFVMAQGELVKGNADAKTLAITDGALLVLDPGSDLAKDKVILKLTGKKTSKEVRKELEGALKKFAEGAPK